MEELKWLGLADIKVKETLKNARLSERFSRIVDIAKQESGNADNEDLVTKQQKTLLYHLGTRIKPQCDQYIPLVIRHIVNDGIRNEPQLAAAIDFLLSNAVAGVDEASFLEACGANVVVTPDQIEDQVRETIQQYREDLLKQRYSCNIGRIISDIKTALKWADGAVIKKEVDFRLMLLLGPKTEEELLGPKKKDPASTKTKNTSSKKGPKVAQKDTKIEMKEKDEEGAATIEELMKKKVHFHKVGENFKTDGYVITPNTMQLLKNHVKAVGGKVVTRFPPEPNGILHIGHAKAINVDFGYAKAHGGICYLRFDDTNPEKEEEKFFTGIKDMVYWLGYVPYKVTHSSDYFDQLYEWAVELIKKDFAYVCHQRVDEMRGFDVPQSPWRNRPIHESLQLFEDMRRGKFEESSATLRLKTTLEEGKVDPVAYRIKYCAHHRTGNKWCIYPTYDYTHCLCDSIENITHSLCTKEFQSRRSSYYWLCNALDIYCPVQWEYGRLNMYYTVVSKRKIKKLIDNKIVSNWDDPRLFTLTALRRRGIPPEAINNFVAGLGLTGAQAFVEPHMLDAVVREYLNTRAPRTMAVLEPLKVIIENFDELDLPCTVEIPDFPSNPEISKTHSVAFEKTIYIEQSDFRESNEERDYRRLSKVQSVGLKHIGIVLSVVKLNKDSCGGVELIVQASSLTKENKPKSFIHWVCRPVPCEVRLYDRLFKHKTPEDPNVVPGGFLSDCNKDSLKVLRSAYMDKSIAAAKVYDRFQFERVGFFSVDPDSTYDKLVFNMTIALKEDVGKN